MDAQNESIALPTSLRRIGIESVEQALLVAPAGYRDCTSPITVLPVPDTNFEVFITLRIEKIVFQNGSKNETSRDDPKLMRVWGVVIDELGGECFFLSYKDLPLWRNVHPGDIVNFYGLFTVFDGRKNFSDPVLVDSEASGRVIPYYKGKQGLVSAESIEKGVQAARPHLVASGDWLLEKTGLSARLFKDYCGLTPSQLLADLHWPETMHEATVALAAAREVSIRAVQEQVRRQQERPIVPESALDISREQAIDMCKDLLGKLPFVPTEDQKRAIWHIMQDLMSESPMRRMLSGDVGTGKTATFFIPAVIAHKQGWPVAIIAPNRLLVAQIASELSEYFPDVPVVQVVSGVKLGADAFSQHAIFIGTTALVIAAENAGQKFRLLISDEQQKFSVDQRQALVGPESNVLESTATAIPRTVALVSMGGLDVSELKMSPVKKTIKSGIREKKNSPALFAFLKQQIKQGGQVAVIYPLAERPTGKAKQKSTGPGSKKGGLDPNRSVEAAMMRYAKHFGERVGLIHGKLKASEKTAVIRKMNEGELDVLVSSTVIEIGLTLPSLRVVVVINPERFGVSQLHQLRGRLARKGGVGYFVMLDLDGALTEGSDALARMQLLEQCNDGFQLAIRDAEMRGAGEIFNDFGQQSGATRSIFFGVELTYNDIERAALEAAYQGDKDRLPVGISSVP